MMTNFSIPLTKMDDTELVIFVYLNWTEPNSQLRAMSGKVLKYNCHVAIPCNSLIIYSP